MKKELLKLRSSDRNDLSILELVKQSYKTAKSHGWWDGKKHNIPEKIALMHSELSEALEEYRGGHPLDKIYYNINSAHPDKPEGFCVELADELIRISDFIGKHKLEQVLIDALYLKLEYNTTRPHRHGDKKC